jgi:enoyl-CoA hydratase/carnithine racemase
MTSAMSGQNSGEVIVTADGPVRILRLNRPDKKNALTDAMYNALVESLESASSDDAIRCVVITGGPAAFTAGADLNDFLSAARGETDRFEASRFLHVLARAGKPLVAAVEGVAVGIGTTMLLHCDYVVAAENARLQTPFVNLGLVPEAASSLLLPRLVGPRRAFEILAMCRPFSAADARAMGIVNEVVADGQAEAHALKAAHHIAALPAEAVAMARDLIRGSTADITARIDEELQLFRRRLRSDEARAAFERFFSRKG